MSAQVIAITPGDGRDLRPWLQALGAAGLPALLIRERAPTTECDALITFARQHIPRVLVHARCARARHADGLHLPAGYAAPTAGCWGRSCHSRQDVDAALAAGASWAFYSPVWRPTSKPDDVRPTLGETGFLKVARGRPVYALGGVTAERHKRLIRSGAHGTAVLGDLFEVSSPTAAAERLLAYLGGAHSTAKMKISGS